MGKTKKDKDGKVRKVTVEFNVSMHCNACERSVAKAISKVKGVEKFITDMPRNRVVVIGWIKPEKIAKKIKKKTGKRARMVACEEEEESDDADGGKELPSKETSNHMIMEPLGSNCCLDDEVYTMFSDENPNACSIM